MTAQIYELFPIDPATLPQGRLQQLNREIASIEAMGWQVWKEVTAKERELETLRGNAKLILETYRMALDERDHVQKMAVVAEREAKEASYQAYISARNSTPYVPGDVV